MDPCDGRVVSNLICQALRGDELTIYGDGSQTRSFCHVPDLVAGLMALMEADIDGMEAVNLGNPDEMTVNELLTHVVRLTGTTAPIVHHPIPVDDPRRRPDITRAGELLDWTPRMGAVRRAGRDLRVVRRGAGAGTGRGNGATVAVSRSRQEGHGPERK